MSQLSSHPQTAWASLRHDRETYVFVGGLKTGKTGFECQMCGKCCERYTIPVNLSDLRRISAFTGLNPAQFLELIIFDKSVASTYDGIPKIELEGESENILVLKEESDRCMFLKDKRCAIYQARPLRCRPFPFSYERKRGKIVFTINEKAREFCKGLGRESKKLDFAKLSSVALAMEKEQDILREKVEKWNARVLDGRIAKSTMSDLLKFLLPHTRYVRP